MIVLFASSLIQSAITFFDHLYPQSHPDPPEVTAYRVHVHDFLFRMCDSFRFASSFPSPSKSRRVFPSAYARYSLCLSDVSSLFLPLWISDDGRDSDMGWRISPAPVFLSLLSEVIVSRCSVIAFRFHAAAFETGDPNCRGTDHFVPASHSVPCHRGQSGPHALPRSPMDILCAACSSLQKHGSSSLNRIPLFLFITHLLDVFRLHTFRSSSNIFNFAFLIKDILLPSRLISIFYQANDNNYD